MRLIKLSLLFGTLLGYASAAYAVPHCTVWGELQSKADTNIVSMNSPSKSQFDLQGRLIYRPLLVAEKFHWLGFELYQAQAKLNKTVSTSNEYAVPFAVKVSNNSGEVLDYRFNAKLKAADQQKLIALYRAFHRANPPENLQGDKYWVKERDDIGQYKSLYTVLADNKLKRNKLSYLEPTDTRQSTNAAKKLMQLETANIISDEFTFENDKCWLTKTLGNSHIQVSSSDGSMNIEVQQTLSLNRSNQSIPDDARLLQLPEDPNQWENLSTDWVYPKAPPQPLKNTEAFFTALKSMDWLEGDRKTLLQFLYDNDQYLLSLKELISTKSIADPLESKLFMYLGKHDSVNSKQLLTEVFVEPGLFSPNQRFRSLMALKYSEKPLTDMQVEAIFEYSMSYGLDEENSKLAHSALMVMGAIAKNQQGSEFSAQLTQKLADSLSSSATEQKASALIIALGNSGDYDHQQLIGDYLAGDSARLRLNAAEALAKMPSKTSLNYLSNQLNQENDSKAQGAILKAMGNNELDAEQVDSIYAFADASNPKDIRSAAISALSQQAKSKPEVKSRLKALVKTETNQKNLRQLMKALYGS
ncbi:HEAT repeat domain-containing protein [Pseudoalteromonas sp. ACER1]|uniref:HEAT repeat domain-containing protein n=1 Tax=unclassified Pseudoalteromonas TaxID=194690 RepID=UPI001F429C9C|nr:MULTISPECIES: HEAT repeat domain-containing protein [unclassified Pseudoalteromonas]MCF2849726.1 HEAT repeat domain-containing protein [Pseudoalteromonas sp. PAST1]MCO7213191.1 HEAT repeat domain-containing protein [Pseudoalteromonas sp. ACER1]